MKQEGYSNLKEALGASCLVVYSTSMAIHSAPECWLAKNGQVIPTMFVYPIFSYSIIYFPSPPEVHFFILKTDFFKLSNS
jgi:hypothetical protein